MYRPAAAIVRLGGAAVNGSDQRPQFGKRALPLPQKENRRRSQLLASAGGRSPQIDYALYPRGALSVYRARLEMASRVSLAPR